MCKCRPEIRTPFCGKENCVWPVQATEPTPINSASVIHAAMASMEAHMPEQKPENPPAVPPYNGLPAMVGITLRDYFAGQVILGQYPRGFAMHGMTQTPEETAEVIAKNAYMMADAMLHIRQLEQERKEGV